MNTTTNLMLRVAPTVALALAIAPPALGQRNGQGPGQNDNMRAEREMRERDRRNSNMSERTFALRMLEKEAGRPVQRQEPQLAFAQINEAFMRIQFANNNLVVAISRDATPDLKYIAKSASEIKKHADCLKYNLMLPEPEKGYQKPKAELATEHKQLMSSLLTLNQKIIGFVNNPMFKDPNVLDAKTSGNARRDLDWIIELSGIIKKSSEKLSKITTTAQ